MAETDLDFEIFRKNRRMDSLRIFADPDDTRALQGALKRWLERERWHPARWSEFSADVRIAGRGRIEATVTV